nr:MAG TPA: hypothetical protein [Caudoviricetes sp.]
MANMMSLNVSDEVIKAAVREEVNAGIVKALGNPEIVVRDAIQEMTNKYVDSTGEFVKKDSWRAMPYFDWLAKNTIEKTVKEEIKYINENREEFAKEIRKQLQSTNFKESIAASFLKSLSDIAESSWNMPINVSFEQPED